MTTPTPDEYTPTTAAVRSGYAATRKFEEAFDRWLARHDAEVGEKVAQAIEAVLPNADTFEARLGLNVAARIAREVTS